MKKIMKWQVIEEQRKEEMKKLLLEEQKKAMKADPFAETENAHRTYFNNEPQKENTEDLKMDTTKNEYLKALLNSMIRERIEPGGVYENRNKILKKVMAAVKDGADVNIKNDEGMTALMYAQEIEQTEFFIKAGADVNATDNRGYTALMHADRLKQTKLLLQAGADVFKVGWRYIHFAGEKIFVDACSLARTSEQRKLIKHAMVKQWPKHMAKKLTHSAKNLWRLQVMKERSLKSSL